MEEETASNIVQENESNEGFVEEVVIEEEKGKSSEGEEEEEEEQVEEQVAEKPEKQRRCQRRKKVCRTCFYDDDDFGEDLGEAEFYQEEEDEDEEAEDEEEEDEGSNDISYGPSVLSAISFEWENEVYEFEELCDPGNINSIYRRIYHEPELPDETGVDRYLQLCRALKVTPTLRIIKSLRTKEIDLSYRNIDAKNIRALCAALQTNSIVQRLILKFNRLLKEDCFYVGLMLGNNESISVLDFSGCRIGPESLELLIENLSSNETLTELNLSRCNILDEGMKMLSSALMKNNSIEKLDLSYNKLGDVAAESLAAAFRINSSIKDLNLSYNYLYNPNAMRVFFRGMIYNRSITHLNLTWNGLNGEFAGGQIGNFIRTNRSILLLDLADNRFQGLAVTEIKRGLSRAQSLETLKLGKNPMTPEDLDVLLSGAKGCSTLKVLDLEDLWVNKSFLKLLKKIQRERDLEVKFAGIYGDYQVFGPDYPKIILERAQYEAKKPKSIKKRKDFGHLIWTLGEEPLTEEEFMARVKKFKAKVDKGLYPELIKQFLIPKQQLIDVVALKKKYLSIFPDSTPPPPPKPKKGEIIKEPEVTETGPELFNLDLAESAAAEAFDFEGGTELEDEEGDFIIEGIEVNNESEDKYLKDSEALSPSEHGEN